MLTEPHYEDKNDTVTLTLRNKVTDHMETFHADIMRAIEEGWDDFSNTQQGLIVELLHSFEETVSSLAFKLEVSEQTVRNNLKKLESSGVIERVSEKSRDKNAIYRFKQK
mgnify:CR=1 FL=1